MFEDYDNENMTLKEVLDRENILDDILSADQFRKMLTTQKVQGSFASYDLNTPLTTKARGLITMPEVFNSFHGIAYDADTVNDVKKFLNDYGTWTVSETMGDNTYNYCAPAEDYINTDILTIVKPDNYTDNDPYSGTNCDCIDVVLFSCGVSLDPRGGYTQYMIALFDNDSNDHYRMAEWFNKSYDLVSGSFNYNNKAFNFGIDGSLNSETVEIFIDAEDKNDYTSYFDDSQCVDTTEPDDIKDALKEIMEDNVDDNKDAKIDSLKINFECYPIN